MTQAEVNRAVARATGESVRTIQRLGFLIADPDSELTDPEFDEYGDPLRAQYGALERESLRRLATHGSFASAAYEMGCLQIDLLGDEQRGQHDQ